MRLLCSLLAISASCALGANPSWHLEGGAKWVEGQVASQKPGSIVEMPIPADSRQTLGLSLPHPSTETTSLTFLEGGREIGKFSIGRDKEGNALTIQPMSQNPATGNWDPSKGDTVPLVYRPSAKEKAAWTDLQESKLAPQSWTQRPLEIRIDRHAGRLIAYLDGVLAADLPMAQDQPAQLRIALAADDRLSPGQTSPWEVAAPYQPLYLNLFAAPTDNASTKEKLLKVDGLPFLVPAGGKGAVDLRKACWPMAKIMPGGYFADYDAGLAFLHDKRTPLFWAPLADYSSLHLLVLRTPESREQTDNFSVRLGTFGGRGQVLFHDYLVTIPKKKGTQVISVPITETIAQDLSGSLQIAFNKELRLSRRSPDPNRYQYRPLGLPPGVELLGATLERAPLSLKLSPSSPGGVFEGVKAAQYQATLRNETPQQQDFSLEATARDTSGKETSTHASGSLAPGEAREIPVRLEEDHWGFFKLDLRLSSSNPAQTLGRKTTFALLPPDTRTHRDASPFGTWTFDGGHATCPDPDVIGLLLKEAGFRFGMGKFPADRAKWGLRDNFEAKAISTPEKYAEWKAKNPDALPVALLMHEHSISADQVSRTPDLFTGRAPYQLNEKEKARFKTLWDEQIKMARLMRENFPEVHLRLGNGPLPTKEEFLRAGFPPDLFDSLGNEAASFGRLPETQPPDSIANNASLWMDHELLKAYGYADKGVSQCYEITYPSTNPGNLSPMDQAAYFLRHALHSLAWGIKEIRFGALDDAGNSYRFSNWGSSGLMYAWPHLHPKPSYVAVATLTRMLDGAIYQGTLDTSTPSVYAMHFSKPESGDLFVLWTLRGERPVALTLSGSGWKAMDWEGNEISGAVSEGTAKLELSGMPIFLTGSGTVSKLELGSSQYSDAPSPKAQTISTLNSIQDWTVQTGQDPILENHDPLTPRRLGSLRYEIEQKEADHPVLKITSEPVPGPETLPMYGALSANQPLPLPGQPTDLGIWVDGNSGWGRVIFELVDASGQTWISIGASRTDAVSDWMLDWLPKDFAKSQGRKVTQADWNTNDVFGLSSINFDGWRYVRFPLPGNYPGEFSPWPANSQWRSDKDGVVHYPLRLTRLIFEFPEKVLKLTQYAPAPRQTIRVKNLTVDYGSQGGVKKGVYEDEE